MKFVFRLFIVWLSVQPIWSYAQTDKLSPFLVQDLLNHQEFVEAVKADSGLLCSQQLLLSPHIKVDSISTLKFDNKPVLVGDTSVNSNCPSAFINIDSQNKNKIEVYVMVTTTFDYVSGGCSFYRRVEYQAEVKVKKAYWKIKYGEVRRSSGNIRWL